MDTDTDFPISETFFVRRRGKVDGPWQVDKLKSEVKLRKLSRVHEVSEDGSNWQRADKFDWLFPARIIPLTPSPTETASIQQQAPVEVKAPEVVKNTKWFLAIKGTEVGPMSSQEVVQRIATGVAGPNDMGWNEGLHDWELLCELPEFSSCFAQESYDEDDGFHAPTESENYEIDPRSVPPGEQTTSLMAIGSLIAGVFSVPLLGVFFLGIPMGFIALIMGMFAHNNISKSQQKLKGKSIATIGALMGVIAACVSIILATPEIIKFIQPPQ